MRRRWRQCTPTGNAVIEVTVGRNAVCEVPVDYASTPYEEARSTPAISGFFGVILLASVFLLPLLATLRPVTDSDIWWHLRGAVDRPRGTATRDGSVRHIYRNATLARL